MIRRIRRVVSRLLARLHCWWEGHDLQEQDLFAAEQDHGFEATLELWMLLLEPGERLVLDRCVRRCRTCEHRQRQRIARIILVHEPEPSAASAEALVPEEELLL